MKKYILKMIMLLAIAFSFTVAADAQIVVKIRPAAPVVRARPLRPSAAHVWWVEIMYGRAVIMFIPMVIGLHH
jgi:hypothetical protein